MGFKQTYTGPIGQVINVDGTVILGDTSKASDLTRVLVDHLRLIEQEKTLAEPARDQTISKLKAAIKEASAPNPDKTKISDYIGEAAKVVEGASKTTSGLVSLAETLFKIGKWVVAAVL